MKGPVRRDELVRLAQVSSSSGVNTQSSQARPAYLCLHANCFAHKWVINSFKHVSGFIQRTM